MTRWLMAAVLLAPLVVAPSIGPITQAKNAVVLALALPLLAWRGPSPWLRAFAGLAAVSVIASGAMPWSWPALLGIALVLLVHQETARRSDADWRLIRGAIAGAALIQIGWMAVQALDADPIFAPLSYRGAELTAGAPVQGWFGNPMDAALFLGLSLPALVAVSPWLLVPAGVAIASLQATAGLMSLALVAGWCAVVHAPRWVAILLLVLIVVSLAGLIVRVDPQGVGPRPQGWAIAAALAWAKPVAGWGPNALDTPHLRVVRGQREGVPGETWNYFFNEWLQGAMELGLAAPVLVAGYLVSLARRLRGKWAACGEALPGAAVLLAVSLFSIPLRIGPTAVLAALYLGRLEAVAAKEAA